MVSKMGKSKAALASPRVGPGFTVLQRFLVLVIPVLFMLSSLVVLPENASARDAVILAVPFVPQVDDFYRDMTMQGSSATYAEAGCSMACLAMLLQHYFAEPYEGGAAGESSQGYMPQPVGVDYFIYENGAATASAGSASGLEYDLSALSRWNHWHVNDLTIYTGLKLEGISAWSLGSAVDDALYASLEANMPQILHLRQNNFDHYVLACGYAEGSATSHYLVHDPLDFYLEANPGGPYYRTGTGSPIWIPVSQINDEYIKEVIFISGGATGGHRDTSWYFKCPVEPLMTDPNGKRVGIDPVTGVIFSESDAFYYTSGLDNPALPGATEPIQVITFPNPIIGEYQIQLKGVGDGPYEISSNIGDVVIEGTITTGEVKAHTVEYPLPPAAQTLAATEVKVASAVLNGAVNPGGGETSVLFEWGTDPTLATFATTPSVSAGSDVWLTHLSATISSLADVTTYYYRIVASNNAGSESGDILPFTTIPPPPPTVETREATKLTTITAELRGVVNPNGKATDAWFEWGTDPSLAVFSSTATQAIGSGQYGVSVKSALSDLSPGTVYYHRVAASNIGGESRGAIVSLTTLPLVAPTVSTLGTNALTSGSVKFTANVNPNGNPTTCWWEWGTDPAMSSPTTTAVQDLGGGVNLLFRVSEEVTGLASNAVHYYRIVAENSWGRIEGSIESFTTPVPYLMLNTVDSGGWTYIDPTRVFTHVTFKAEFNFPYGLYTAVWTWGDGTTTSESIDTHDTGQWLTRSHDYARTGTYTVNVVLTPVSGSPSNAQIEVMVNSGPDFIGGELSYKKRLVVPEQTETWVFKAANPANFDIVVRVYVNMWPLGKITKSYVLLAKQKRSDLAVSALIPTNVLPSGQKFTFTSGLDYGFDTNLDGILQDEEVCGGVAGKSGSLVLIY